VLIWRSRPAEERHPARIDYRGTVLISAAMGLVVLGLQQSATWGWSSIATWACIVAGLVLMGAFVRFELHAPEPLLRLSIFRDRGFTVETVILALLSIVFVPFFFFASVYSQASLGKTASNAGIYMLYFFFGFVAAAQIGGRILDRRGARPAVVLGSAVGAVGFYLLAGRVTHLSLNAQWVDIVIAGAGLGLMLGVASTDAVNRASSSSYSEVTGITQTARNFGASLGLAALGSILVSRNKVEVPAALAKLGVPKATALRIAASLGSSGAGGSPAGGHQPSAALRAVELAFAHSTQTVFYIMAGVMAFTFLVAVRRLPSGKVAVADEAPAREGSLAADAAAP